MSLKFKYKAKVEEVRRSNAALLNERDELRKRFDGIDPDEARKLFEKQPLQAGEIEKVVEGRLRAAKSDLEKQYAGIAAERDALNGRLTAIQIDQGVTSVATKKGLRPTAIPLSKALSATSDFGPLRIPISYRCYTGFESRAGISPVTGHLRLAPLPLPPSALISSSSPPASTNTQSAR
jgi:hypothetical protein